MTYPVALLPEAKVEADRALQWYEDQRDGLGWEFLNELNATIRRISELPFSFPENYRHARLAVLHRFPYKVYFVVKGDSVEVVGVLHGRQRVSRLRGRL